MLKLTMRDGKSVMVNSKLVTHIFDANTGTTIWFDNENHIIVQESMDAIGTQWNLVS